MRVDTLDLPFPCTHSHPPHTHPLPPAPHHHSVSHLIYLHLFCTAEDYNLLVEPLWSEYTTALEKVRLLVEAPDVRATLRVIEEFSDWFIQRLRNANPSYRHSHAMVLLRAFAPRVELAVIQWGQGYVARVRPALHLN